MTTPHTQRFQGIEGLRAVAAVSITVAHAWLITRADAPVLGVGLITMLMDWFTLGVALFFVLSGFLLYRPFAVAIAAGRPLPSIRAYARRRALRIAPAYWAILALTNFALAASVVRLNAGEAVPGMITNPRALVSDALLLQFYRASTAGTGIGPTWSLAVEVAFYAALPALVWLVARRGCWGLDRRIALLLAPGILLAIGLTGKVVAGLVIPGAYADLGSDHFVARASFPAHADEFALGMLVAVLWLQWEAGSFRLPSRRARMIAEVGLLAVVIASAEVAPSLFPEVWWLIATLLAAILLTAVVIPGPWRVRGPLIAILDSRPLYAVGTVSYSLFLWNVPVSYVLARHGWMQPGVPGLLANIVLVLGVSLVLSAATYTCVERPTMRYRGSLLPIGLARRTLKPERVAGATGPVLGRAPTRD